MVWFCLSIKSIAPLPKQYTLYVPLLLLSPFRLFKSIHQLFLLHPRGKREMNEINNNNNKPNNENDNNSSTTGASESNSDSGNKSNPLDRMMAVAQICSTNDLQSNYNQCLKMAERAQQLGTAMLCYPGIATSGYIYISLDWMLYRPRHLQLSTYNY